MGHEIGNSQMIIFVEVGHEMALQIEEGREKGDRKEKSEIGKKALHEYIITFPIHPLTPSFDKEGE